MFDLRHRAVVCLFRTAKMTTTSFASHSSRSIPGPSSFPARVLAEVCWLLESRIGPDAEAAFLDSVAGGELELAELSNDDVRRMAALVRRYRGFPLGAVDAAVIAIAERLETIEIATLDHRHFRAVKPVHADAFELLP